MRQILHFIAILKKKLRKLSYILTLIRISFNKSIHKFKILHRMKEISCVFRLPSNNSTEDIFFHPRSSIIEYWCSEFWHKFKWLTWVLWNKSRSTSFNFNTFQEIIHTFLLWIFRTVVNFANPQFDRIFLVCNHQSSKFWLHVIIQLFPEFSLK